MPVWKTFRHNGIAFPDPHVPTGLSVKYMGQELKLSPPADEMAYQFAKKKDTPYVQDPVFRQNFMEYFAKQLSPPANKAKFEDIDFSQFNRRVDQEKAKKESMPKEEKKALAQTRKEVREKLRARYGKAFLDGKEIDLGNYMAEPPGLFMGRGQHPLRGSWKPRVGPSDVTLNLDKDAPVPPGDYRVVHDDESIWVARWIDKLTEKEKYVWPHEGSEIQQSRNKEKYDEALYVGERLPKLQKAIRAKLASKGDKERKIATVCYLIDEVGMRVGDEKDEDEADTVGATTLRVEHVKRLDDQAVEFDFLGKDSVRWLKTMKNPDPSLVKNMREFMAGKKPDKEIFDGITSSNVNVFLSSIVPGLSLSAKVFRTYHATRTVEEALKSKDVRNAADLDKLYFAKEANLAAAKYCNHKRTPPKTWEETLKKKEQKLEEYKAKGKDAMAQKMQKDIVLTKETKEYNLNTSMKNYIDPRIYKAWCDYVGLDWEKLYSKSLQRKFSWVAQSRKTWPLDKPASAAPVPTIESP